MALAAATHQVVACRKRDQMERTRNATATRATYTTNILLSSDSKPRTRKGCFWWTLIDPAFTHTHTALLLLKYVPDYL